MQADEVTDTSSNPVADGTIGTFEVAISPNHEPAGTDNTVATAKNTPYTFAAADFGFSDPNDNPPNNFFSVEITTLPDPGTLKLDGTAVTAGQFVTVTDITANKLTFEPLTDGSGSPYSSFTFQVQDDGGTDNGGVNLDQTANTLTIDVTRVNQRRRGRTTPSQF